MALVRVNNSTLKEIADAIRARNMLDETYLVQDMPKAVERIYNNPKNVYQGTAADVIAIGDYTEDIYENDDIDALGAYALVGCKAKKLVLSNVVIIGNNACSGVPIESITTYDFDKALEIGEYAFSNCTQLTTAYFPMVKTINARAFYGCENLQAIYLPNVVNMKNSEIFMECPNLKDIYVGVASADNITHEPWGAKGATIHYGYQG